MFFKYLPAIVLAGSLLLSAQATSANHQQPELVFDIEKFQELLQQLEQQSQFLSKNTENYIRCLEQNTQAEGGAFPDAQSTPEIITREWLDQLLKQLSAGLESSETCQFLLDEILQQLPQQTPENKSSI